MLNKSLFNYFVACELNCELNYELNLPRDI